MVNASSCCSACYAMQTAVRYWMGETDRQTETEVERQREKNKLGDFFFFFAKSMVKASSCHSACDAMQTAIRYWMGWVSETDRQTETEVERQREKNKLGEFFF